VKRKKIEVGDIAEIKTIVGYSYAMFTHVFDEHNDIVAVFDVVSEIPLKESDVDDVIVRPLQFPQVIVSFRKVVRAGIWKWVAHREVPNGLKKFPLLRWFNPLKPNDWWLKDNEKEWRVGKLTDEQMKLPLYSYANHTQVENYITGKSIYGSLRPIV
jgi:hypothetical protein